MLFTLLGDSFGCEKRLGMDAAVKRSIDVMWRRGYEEQNRGSIKIVHKARQSLFPIDRRYLTSIRRVV